MFNLVQNQQINLDFLNELLSKLIITWPSFSKEEFRAAIDKYNNLSIPEPDCYNLKCYELKSLGLDNRTTLILSNTRELNRVSNTK